MTTRPLALTFYLLTPGHLLWLWNHNNENHKSYNQYQGGKRCRRHGTQSQSMRKKMPGTWHTITIKEGKDAGDKARNQNQKGKRCRRLKAHTPLFINSNATFTGIPQFWNIDATFTGTPKTSTLYQRTPITKHSYNIPYRLFTMTRDASLQFNAHDPTTLYTVFLLLCAPNNSRTFFVNWKRPSRRLENLLKIFKAVLTKTTVG